MNRALLFLMVIVSHSALAQSSQTPDNSRALIPSFSISGGVIHFRTIDEGLSFNRLLLTGTGGMVAIGYQLESSRQITTVDFVYYGTNLFHKEGKIPVSLSHGSLTFSHKRQMATYKIASKDCKLFAGLSLGTTINYFESPSLDNEDVLVINAIHLMLQNNVKLNELSGLKITVALPTIALAKRLILDGGLYEPRSDESGALRILYGDSKVVFANSYSFSASFSRRLSTTIKWLVTYNFNYIQNDNLESLRLYSNQVATGLCFNLKR